MNEEGGALEDATGFVVVVRAGVDFEVSFEAGVRDGVRDVVGAAFDVVDVDALAEVGVLGTATGVFDTISSTASGSTGGAGGGGDGSGSGTDAGFSAGMGTSGSLLSISTGASSGTTSEPVLNTERRFHVLGGLVLPVGVPLPLGGQSRFSLASTRAASDVALKLDAALKERLFDGEVAVFALCCSKRPMRFCTLARGRSSGSGLLLS